MLNRTDAEAIARHDQELLACEEVEWYADDDDDELDPDDVPGYDKRGYDY